MKHPWMTAVLLGANLAALVFFSMQRMAEPHRPPVSYIEMAPEIVVADTVGPLTQADISQIESSDDSF